MSAPESTHATTELPQDLLEVRETIQKMCRTTVAQATQAGRAAARKKMRNRQEQPQLATSETTSRHQAGQQAYLLHHLAYLDFCRIVASFDAEGKTATEIATLCDLPLDTINAALDFAKTQPPVVPGQQASSVTEVLQRYATGLMDEEKMMITLMEWPYSTNQPSPTTHGTQGCNTLTEVAHGVSQRLITAAQYRLIKDLIAARRTANQPR